MTKLNGDWVRIARYAPAFMTPKGITTSLVDAVDVCKANDMVPDLTIRPVVIAIAEGDDNVFEIVT